MYIVYTFVFMSNKIVSYLILSHTDITPPHPSRPLSKTPYPFLTYSTLTTETQTQTYVQHSPWSHMIGKIQTQTQSSHPLTPPLLSCHQIHSTLDRIPEPRVPPTCPALTTTIPHPSLTPALPSPSHPHTLSAYTYATQTTVHASQSQQTAHPHRVPRQPHRQTKDYPMTTDTTQRHRPSSKSERNLIILQVNINGIKKQTRGAQTVYSRHTCIYHHNSGNQVHP